MVYSRVEPALMEQAQAEADRRFDGNLSLLVRDSVRLYLRLRAKLGTGFEPTIEAIAPVMEKDPVAA
jgi:hypothetical protein